MKQAEGNPPSQRCNAAEPVPLSIRSVGIAGAGVMGCGIAALNVERGIKVTIADNNPDALARAVGRLRAIAENRRSSLQSSGAETLPVDQLVRAATAASDLGQCDLVIEAISEKLETKRQFLLELAPHLRDGTVVATNTSSIPLSRMADCLPKRGRFCGLHFCYPVELRRLVEVIRGATTSDESIAAAVSYAELLEKNPIVVNDRPGFVVNRLLVPYFNEALELVLDGSPVEDVEKAACNFGMPRGPLHQLDDFGIDVALQTGTVLYLAYPDRIVASRLLIAMYKSRLLGRKTGAGFFECSSSHQLGSEAKKLIEQHRRGRESLSLDEMTRRLFVPMFLESTRILEEQVVARCGDIDVALQDGLGFRPRHGGLIGWAESTGADTLREWLKPMEHLGHRFQPTRTLVEMAGRDG